MSTRLYVIKRDGRLDQFNANKIKNAIYKALATYCSIEESNQKALYLTNLVTEKIIKLNTKEINIEAIQDIVEQTLISQNLTEVAKHYIIYRAKRTQARVLKSDTNKAISNIINIDAKDNDDKRENANINTDTTMGSMLKVGSTVMKEYNLNNLIKPKYAKMHRDGVIHLHDLDFMSLTVNCLQMPLRKLLDHGFSTGHGYLRTPSTIQTACSLTCIAIQSSQNDFFGGQAIPLLDYDLAPYVAKSFVRNLLVDLGFDLANNHVKHEIIAPADARIMLKRHFDTDVMSSDMIELITHCNNLLKEAKVTKEEAVNDDIKDISFFSLDPIEVDANQIQRALYLTKLNTKQGMEALVHNLCTMNSRAGSQTPFSSVNFGTDTSWEGRMVSDAILDAGDAGLGNHETAIFPITIFKMMKGVNDKGSPNYDLFEKACRVSAKRLLPNFQNCSATYNYKYYKPGHPETEVATMGCRTRVISNAFDPDHEICYGRGNLFWTTINLPYIALTARDQVMKGQNIVDKFYELLDDVMTDVIDFSLDRFEIVAKRKAKNYPFSMGQHEYVGSENLLPDDSIRNVLKEGSISIGIIGLAETLIVLCGKHHGESDEAQKLGLEIVRHMRARTDEATTDLNMNFSLMGSPAEGCTGRLCKAIKNKWGVIEGVTDKSYLVNSTHVPPSYKTTIYHKVKIEAPYHELENAGHICYVEQDADISKNPKAFEEIVTFMANENCGYIAINHPVSRDPICGYVGPMNKDGTCPRCGRKEFEGVPAWKLLSLHSYTPDPEYAVTADKIEDDATINDNLLHMGENK